MMKQGLGMSPVEWFGYEVSNSQCNICKSGIFFKINNTVYLFFLQDYVNSWLYYGLFAQNVHLEQKSIWYSEFTSSGFTIGLETVLELTWKLLTKNVSLTDF